MSEDTLRSLKELQEALKAGEQSSPAILSPVIQVEDLSKEAAKYLTASTQEALKKKATQQIVQENGLVYKSIYFAVRTRTGNEEKGIAKLATALNELSASGLIHSCLAPVSSLKLARMVLEVDQSVVFCFVLVPAMVYESIKPRYTGVQVEEGGLGEDVEDMRPDLKDGEFLASIRVSHQLTLLQNSTNEYQRVQAQIDQYLAVLPKGTTVVEVVQCAITDLSIPYEVKFYNPLMKRVKSVETSHMRMAEVVNEKLEQFNLFTGVRYFDADRKELFT